MKKLLLLTLLPAIFNYAFSQCTNVDYYLNISGFMCNDQGKVCFVTNENLWTTMEDCKGFYVEISFPADGFDIEELSNFSLISSSPTTILRYQLPEFPLSQFEEVACFEGELINSGTTFTLKIIDPSDANNVILNTTFQINDNLVTIGNPAQATSIGDWIGGPNELLDSDPMQGQRVIIDGTIIVDEDYIFSSSELSGNHKYTDIYMNPDAKIIIEDGYMLKTTRTNIHGCDEPWDRILVKSGGELKAWTYTTISDAEVAVELEDNATFDNAGTVNIERCSIGIGSFGSSMKNITMNFPVGPSGVKSQIRSCIEGMHFRNVNLAKVEGFLSFLNIQLNGIYLENTNLICKGIVFDECDISINVAKYSSFLSVSNSTFYDCNLGIRSSGNGNMEVSTNAFHNCNTGIERLTNFPFEYSAIFDNFMNCEINIAGTVKPSSGYIYTNNLQASNFNVNLQGMAPLLFQKYGWHIHHNTKLEIESEEEDEAANVRFVNMNGGAIYNNLNVTSDKRNFDISGGYSSRIFRNHAEASNNSTRFQGHPHSSLLCNELSSYNTLQVLDDCNGLFIRGNDFSGIGLNLVYGTPDNTYVKVGVQNHNGNIFEESTSTKATHYGNDYFQIYNNSYLVDYGLTQGSEYFPFYSPALSPWFLPVGNGDCEDNTACCGEQFTDEDPDEDRLKRGIDANMASLDAQIDTIYGEEVAFDSKLKLLRSLKNLQAIDTLDYDMQTWHDSLANSEVSQFIKFETTLQDSLAFSASEDSLAGRLTEEMDTLLDAIHSTVWYEVDTVTWEVTIDTARKAYRDALISSLTDKASDYTALLQSKQDEVDDVLDDLETINGNAGMQATLSGQNLKAVNYLLLERLHSGFSGFDSTQIALLTEIAALCPGEGGEAVYKARALLAEVTGDYLVEYTNECLLELSERSAIPSEMATNAINTNISVFPNPANDRINVTLPDGHSFSDLIITDIFGNRVDILKALQHQTKIHFNTLRLQPGMYFISAENQNSKPVRFVVMGVVLL